MAGPTKQAPLATYLNSSSSESSPASEEAATPVTERSAADSGRGLMLTILWQAKQPVPEPRLLQECEFSPDRYRRIMGPLRQEGLVEQVADGLQLTEQGRAEAERERERLLSIF